MNAQGSTALSWMAALLAGATACSAGGAANHADAALSYTKLDDMEDGGDRIEWTASGLARGSWWTSTDCTAAHDIAPVATAVDPGGWAFAALPAPHPTMPGVTSARAARLRTTAPLMGIWGANMGFNAAERPGADASAISATAPDGGTLIDPEGCPVTVDWNAVEADLGAYSGITFWAMADPAGTQTIRVAVDDVNTDPRGGVCDATTPGSSADCYNSFAASLNLTDTFTQYTIDFASLQQDPSWGYHPSPDVVDTRNVFQLSFRVDLPPCTTYGMCAGGSPSVTFDFWIDDLYLINR
jgi:hypothetical protein